MYDFNKGDLQLPILSSISKMTYLQLLIYFQNVLIEILLKKGLGRILVVEIFTTLKKTFFHLFLSKLIKFFEYSYLLLSKKNTLII